MFANWNILIPPEMDKVPRPNPATKRARLTSITYPRCLALASADQPPISPPDLASLVQAFAAIRKPPDITAQQLQLLNVSYTYDLPLAAVIPAKYHPDETDDASVFNQRRREVSVENVDAYDTISRRRRDIKIGNFYRFFQAAETMEQLLAIEPAAPGSPTAAAATSAAAGAALIAAASAGLGLRSATGGLDSTAMGRTTAKFREEMLRQFVDPICWGSDMRIYNPRYPPKLLSRRSLFNVKADMYIYQQPPTMQERKEGVIIGPAVVLQTRNDDRFSETDDVVDAVHELSALLTLGQERQRKKSIKKIVYRAVGRDDTLDGDDLFLLSSVQSHLAISHVYLTDAYSRFIRTGHLPPAEYILANPEWCACRIGRTKWHNLLEPDGRVEALRAVMAVIAWLKRDL